VSERAAGPKYSDLSITTLRETRHMLALMSSRDPDILWIERFRVVILRVIYQLNFEWGNNWISSEPSEGAEGTVVCDGAAVWWFDIVDSYHVTSGSLWSGSSRLHT
jgi:hypothetical protein